MVGCVSVVSGGASYCKAVKVGLRLGGVRRGTVW